MLRISVPGAKLSEEARCAVDPHDHASMQGSMPELPQDLLQGALYVSMRMKEAWLVDKAFQSVIGTPDPCPQHTREELIDSLTEDYRFFGLASGRVHTEQLVRDFEAETIAQAKTHLGPGPVNPGRG
jgi:hypothetical protein